MSRSRGGFQVTVSPPMRMSPAVTSSSPAIIRRVVVFPQPDGPTRMQNSRSRMVSSIPATASTSPKRLTTRSRTTSAMVGVGRRSDGAKLLLGVVHGGADGFALRHFEVLVDVGVVLGCRAVGADRVADHRALAGGDEAVVGAVVPAQHLVGHGLLEELLPVGEDVADLLAPEADLPFLVEHVCAES